MFLLFFPFSAEGSCSFPCFWLSSDLPLLILSQIFLFFLVLKKVKYCCRWWQRVLGGGEECQGSQLCRGGPAAGYSHPNPCGYYFWDCAGWLGRRTKWHCCLHYFIVRFPYSFFCRLVRGWIWQDPFCCCDPAVVPLRIVVPLIV